jgi:YD repeat-containing protein
MRLLKIFILEILLTVTFAQAQAPAPGMPPGTLGWWAYGGDGTTIGAWHYTSNPVSACKDTAFNHMGTELVKITPFPGTSWPKFSCWYPHFLVVGGVHDYATTYLECEIGYNAVEPGLCVRQEEEQTPPTCGDISRPLIANPVSPLSGVKYESVEDNSLGDRNRQLAVRRYYRSTGRYDEKSAGMGWAMSFDRTLSIDGIGYYVVRLEDGSRYRFLEIGAGNFSSATTGSGVSLKIKDVLLGEWEFRGLNDRLDRYVGFKLVSSRERGGYEQFFTYGALGQLQTITDSFGRILTLSWLGDVVTSIRSATTLISYSYAPLVVEGGYAIPETERLVSVTTSRLDGTEASTIFYHYESAVNLHLLTGVTDQTGTRYANFAFDGEGRATLSEHANGAQRVALAYNADGSTTVTDALGSNRIYSSQYVNHSYKSTGVSQPGGSGCAPSAQSLAYDYLGNLAESRDFNNRLSCFIYDYTRSLGLKRVEGLSGASCPGTVVAGLTRTINTEWHADFRLPTRIAEPGRIVTNTYDGLGNVLSRSEQATSDSSGALGFAAVTFGTPRVWSYTYNAVGQMLSADGPLAGTTDQTTYEYYLSTDTAVPPKWRVGDLKKITNPSGHVSTFDEYDLEGRLLKKTDPNGAVTVSTYHLRGWLTSTTKIAGGISETMSYEYWPTGKLKKMVQADGSFLSYSYDAAQRLTGIVDNLGNTVSYTLDNAGNRTAEAFKDTGGALRRNIARSFDALSRVQSVTGAAQ